MQPLVLGTAQWGTPYGVTNTRGRLPTAELAAIVDVAEAAGIRQVDTAAGYGDAEERLRPWASRFAVTTKVRGSAPIGRQVRASLEALGASAVAGCLLHDWSILDRTQAETAVAGLREAQDAGLVGSIGVSGYDEADLERALDLFGVIDLVQVPVSVLDRRLANSTAVGRILDTGGQVQARSVFLQGILAGSSATALGRHPDVVGFRKACAARGWIPLEAALGFVAGLDWVTQIVVGATSAVELRQIADACSRVPAVGPSDLPHSDDLELVDPRRWA